MNILVSYGADILVILASLGAMSYCIVLSRRLSRLTSFDTGLGGAIAVMSSQVDEMKAALREAKAGSDGAGNQLTELVQQAREISSELEMMIAACHDFAEEAISVQAQTTKRPEPLEPDGQPDIRRSSEPLAAANSTTSEPGPSFATRRSIAQPADEGSASVEPLFGRRKLTTN